MEEWKNWNICWCKWKLIRYKKVKLFFSKLFKSTQFHKYLNRFFYIQKIIIQFVWLLTTAKKTSSSCSYKMDPNGKVKAHMIWNHILEVAKISRNISKLIWRRIYCEYFLKLLLQYKFRFILCKIFILVLLLWLLLVWIGCILVSITSFIIESKFIKNNSLKVWFHH